MEMDFWSWMAVGGARPRATEARVVPQRGLRPLSPLPRLAAARPPHIAFILRPATGTPLSGRFCFPSPVAALLSLAFHRADEGSGRPRPQ